MVNLKRLNAQISMRGILSLVLAAGIGFSCANFTGLVSMAEPTTALNAGGLTMIDLPNSSAKTVKLAIEDGRFASQSVKNLMMEAHGIDFRQGTLDSLHTEVLGGNFDNNVLVDQFIMNTQAFSFDTVELLNNQRFILDKPVTATISMKVSEDNLNQFLSNPKTIEKLEKAVAKKTGEMKVVTFSNPHLELMGGDKVRMNLDLSMGVLGQNLVTPLQIDGVLKIKSNRMQFRDLQVSSQNSPLPVNIAAVVQDQLNSLIDLQKLGKGGLTLEAQKLKISRKDIEISGVATLTRLEFGKK